MFVSQEIRIMKFWKILLGIYQAIIAVFSLVPVFYTIYIVFEPSPNAVYHLSNLFMLLLLLIPTIIFCSCNAVKLLVPARNIFAKWKNLTQISTVFTILWTLLFAYLLIFQTSSGSCRTSVPETSLLKTGQTAPDFSIKDQFGKTTSLSELRGKPVLLDFWGVWCGPCRQKLPHTQKIYEKFKDKGLAVIGIHSAFRTKKAAAFIAENNYSFPTGVDPGNIAKDYGIAAWPTYYLIDKQGAVVWGPEHAPPSERLIKSLLKD